MNNDVIPLNEIGKIGTVKVYNQAYVDKQQKRIEELEEDLRHKKIAIQNRNKRIKELEKKLTEKVTLESLDVVSARIEELEKENAGLKVKNDQLTNATEIIKQLMYAPRECIAWYCLFDKAKQFLKEIDK